jgi:hypothetical protein
MSMESAPIDCVNPFGIGLPVRTFAPWYPSIRHMMCLVSSLLVILIEVGFLTPFVEIPDGPLAAVANHHVCAGLLFALVAMVVSANRDARPLILPKSNPVRLHLGWIGIHLILYVILFQFSVRSSDNTSPAALSWLAAAAWVLLAAGVGFTAILIFFPWRMVAAWAQQRRGTILTSAALGAAVAVLGPWFQSWWPVLSGPALAVNHQLLQWVYGEAIAAMTSQGAVLGTRRLYLLVTPGCSALDALAGFWLLAAVIVIPGWRDLHKTYLTFGLALGTVCLYALLALRLFVLVLVGTEISPKVCVGVAHSQITGIAILGFDIALLACLCRWCRRRPNDSVTPAGSWNVRVCGDLAPAFHPAVPACGVGDGEPVAETARETS